MERKSPESPEETMALSGRTRKSPASKPDLLVLSPVEGTKAKIGRPSMKLSPLNLEGMSEAEQQRYDLFLTYMRREYGDLSPFDTLLVELAAIEYVKYLRWLAKEIKTGETASMARQNPGVQMRENLKMLSIWRKDRANAPGKAEDDSDKIVAMFTGQSR